MLLGGGLLAAVVVAGNSGGPDSSQTPTGTPQVTATPTGGVTEETWTIPATSLQPARKISAREWQLIAKSPDAHTGERIIVYGQVVQFDATTGGNGFRGNVDGVEHKPQYGWADYKTNTILHSDDESVLANVVQDDLFRAEVTVAGSKSYETVMGGTLTAPQLTVTKIETIGHV